MPIALTDSFDPGDYDVGQSYPKAKILRFDVDTVGKRIDMLLGFGEIVEDVWVKGAATKKVRFSVVDVDGDPAFTNLVEQSTLDGETFWDAAKRLAYAHVQTENAELAGTVS